MTTPHTDPARLTVDYHDGRSEQAQPVSIWVSDGMLELAGHGVLRQVPIQQVQWPDPIPPGVLVIFLPGGGTLRCDDPKAWDAWLHHQSLEPHILGKPKQSWRWSLAATLLLLAICAASYVLALPLTKG